MLNYIPSTKIFFELGKNNLINIYFQKSTLVNETYYIIQYRKLNSENLGKEKIEELELNPSLFIFLLDQSGSMEGKSIKFASNAFLLFLQSLPAGTYYQIFGFGSDFKKYDEIPKEYSKKI